MKSLVFSLAFMLIGSFAFANTKEVKKVASQQTTAQSTVQKAKTVRQQLWRYRCSDGVVTEWTCGCTQAQATAMGRAWCNAR